MSNTLHRVIRRGTLATTPLSARGGRSTSRRSDRNARAEPLPPTRTDTEPAKSASLRRCTRARASARGSPDGGAVSGRSCHPPTGSESSAASQPRTSSPNPCVPSESARADATRLSVARLSATDATAAPPRSPVASRSNPSAATSATPRRARRCLRGRRGAPRTTARAGVPRRSNPAGRQRSPVRPSARAR